MKILFTALVLGVIGLSDGQKRPPNYSLEQMPTTSFNCRDKIIGGYYADPETDCQMFHVCVRVPGLGVQDFKFLCPNDTSFDQENQICDDWYNIDCETSTLFYSDNFDLYRLGSEGGSRVRAVSLNNAVSDVEDNVYLQQRSDRGENVAKDLLRGSQSGNFFSNKGGRDDEDFGKDELYKPKKKTVNKAPVRKLVPKRPTTQQTVQTTTEAYRTPGPRERGLGNRNFRGQHVQKAQQEQQATTEAYQRSRNQYSSTQNQYQNAVTQRTQFYRTNEAHTPNYYTTTVAPTTQKPSWQQAYNVPTTIKPNNNWQQAYNVPTTVKPSSNNWQQAYNAPTTVKPSSNNWQQAYNAPTTIKPSSNSWQQAYNAPTTVKPSSNSWQQAYNAPTTVKPSSNNWQQAYNDPTTVKPSSNNWQQAYNAPTTLKPSSNSWQQAYNTPTTQKPNWQTYTAPTSLATTVKPYYESPTTLKSNYYQGTTYRPNYFETQRANLAASTTQAPQQQDDYYNYEQGQETNNNYETQKLYRINLGAAVGVQPPQARIEEKDEFLKTAPSQNLAQSAFNRVRNTYKTSVSAAYDVPAVTATTTTTGRPLTTTTTGKPRPFAANSPTKSQQDAAYDYAYYDDGTASEYENVENLEEFSRTTSRKRST